MIPGRPALDWYQRLLFRFGADNEYTRISTGFVSPHPHHGHDRASIAADLSAGEPSLEEKFLLHAVGILPSGRCPSVDEDLASGSSKQAGEENQHPPSRPMSGVAFTATMAELHGLPARSRAC
jgi:hypothetical protein